jgi:S1-C subfamily serine protease
MPEGPSPAPPPLPPPVPPMAQEQPPFSPPPAAPPAAPAQPAAPPPLPPSGPPGTPYGAPAWGAPAGLSPYGPPLGPPLYPAYATPYGWAPPPPPAPPVQKVRVVQTLTRRTWIWILCATVLLAASLGALVGAVVGLGSQQTIVEKYFPNGSVIKQSAPVSIQEILSKVEPAVVSITTVVERGGNGPGGTVDEGAGTGMIITPDGEVLTNNHVVAGATTVHVSLLDQTRELAARVIGTDPSQDVALVQIEGQHGLPTVSLGNSDSAQVGDDVIAIGNSLALQGGPTVTSGIVSAEGRTLSAESEFTNQQETLHGLLQTDAAINPGNSGGPLVNSNAQVIGMNTAVAVSGAGNAPAENVGFAIAINTIKPLFPQLRRGGTGGVNGGVPAASGTNTSYLGVGVRTVTPSLVTQDHLSTGTGALVVTTDPSGPARKAGIKVGDVIVTVDGIPIKTADGLVTTVHSHKPGDTVTIGIVRGTSHLQISVTLSSVATAEG